MASTAHMSDFSSQEYTWIELLSVREPILFPIPEPHYAYVRKLKRNSGLTSVRWYDNETLFTADFAAKTVYRVKPFSDQPIVQSIRTPNGEGLPTETDLMDIRQNTMVLTNFYAGEIGFYNVSSDSLEFSHIVDPPSSFIENKRGLVRSLIRKAKGKKLTGKRKVHGAIFVPGYEDLLWISFCDARRRGAEITKLDGTPIHSLALPEQGQDVTFLDFDGEKFAVQAARTDHITKDAPNERNIYVTLYVYRLPENLNTTPPELVLTEHFPGHLDAIKTYKNAVYAANQHDCCVDEFFYDPVQNKLELNRRFKGFDMPHGLDISPDGKMAVTNYGPENDLRFYQLDR